MAAELGGLQPSGGSAWRCFPVGGSFPPCGLVAGCPRGSPSPVPPAGRLGSATETTRSTCLSRVTMGARPAVGELHPLEVIPFYQHPHFLHKPATEAPVRVVPWAERPASPGKWRRLDLVGFLSRAKEHHQSVVVEQMSNCSKACILRTIPIYR